jgi:ankyrin repeat protein
VVKLLLNHGAQTTAAAMDDMNALHFAAQKGNTEVVRTLLNAGKAHTTYHPPAAAIMYCHASH